MPEEEEPTTGRIRYDPELNVEFWGFSHIEENDSNGWARGGVFALAGANELVTVAAGALALISLAIVF